MFVCACAVCVCDSFVAPASVLFAGERGEWSGAPTHKRGAQKLAEARGLSAPVLVGAGHVGGDARMAAHRPAAAQQKVEPKAAAARGAGSGWPPRAGSACTKCPCNTSLGPRRQARRDPPYARSLSPSRHLSAAASPMALKTRIPTAGPTRTRMRKGTLGAGKFVHGVLLEKQGGARAVWSARA